MYGRRPQLGGPFPNGTPIPESQITFRNPESGKVGAYHGSPHKFEAFSMEKVGTGEGAQAYGHGLYFAENKGVARMYRDQLQPRPEITNMKLGGSRDVLGPASDLNVGPHNNFDYNPRGNTNYENIRSSLAEELLLDESELATKTTPAAFREHVLDLLDRRIANMRNDWPDGVADALRLRADLDRPGAVALQMKSTPGSIYHVEIDAEPHQFLDWDKPLREQSPEVRAAVSRALGRDVEAAPDALIRDWHLEVAPRGRKWVVRDAYGEYGTYASQEAAQNRRYDLASARTLGGHTGQQIYQKLGFKNPADASQALNQAGIKGIRYLDQGSRGTGQGTSNYVVFDDKLVKIINREGFSGAKVLGPLAAALAAGSLGAKALNARKRGILP